MKYLLLRHNNENSSFGFATYESPKKVRVPIFKNTIKDKKLQKKITGVKNEKD